MEDLIVIFLLKAHICIFGLYILFLVIDIKKHRRRKEKVVILLSLLACTIIYLQSDFVKSRKKVNKEWMIGKTLDSIDFRYAYPHDAHKGLIQDMDPYVLCAHEIYKWNAIDGIQAEHLYYVLLDDNGKVVDVKIQNYDEYGLIEPISYWDRW